ncbi:MAG: head protein [Podoviridae sp. ctdc61]|nr:MAG: head protein [Podoviridae sp. ctdc61]
MKVNQLHTLVNSVTKEVLGETAVVNEDLSNVVAIGKTIIDTDNIDNYVKKLVNHIGKVIFVNRLYAGGVPSVLMDSWEYGSILEKISAELPEATENSSWMLEDGTDYSPNTFHQPKVEAKFFNSKITFEIPLSFTEIQVKESFSNAEQLNGFVSMLQTAVENAMTVRLDALIMRTINNMTAETLSAELGSTGTVVATGTGVKAVNLMKLYNEGKTAAQKVTKANALQSPDFIRYATYTIGLYSDRMSKISKLFNVGGKERFTPKDLQTTVLLSDFAKSSETFLGSDIHHPDKVMLPQHDSVPYWQGSGLAYDFNDVSKIDVKTSGGKTVSLDGILGVMFDRDALGVTNLDRRVTTNYNPKAEFFTNFYKFESGHYNDLNENYVVFFIG